MKLTLKSFGLLFLLVVQTAAHAQTPAQKRVLVYFLSGVQRNAVPNQNTVTISSGNVTQVLTNYGLNAVNVSPAFPNFNEADTLASEVGEPSRQMNYAKVFLISLPDTSFKSSLIASLRNLSEVLYAESDGDIGLNIIPNDTRFGQQWNMRNTVVPGADIHAEAAWDIFTGNPNAIIGIIDAGVDVNHNDLAAKIAGGDATFQINIDNLGRQFSHGTHVAGIAAAITNNNNGVAGVDWQARIFTRNVIGNSGDAVVNQAIRDAVNFNANVWTINNSWSTRNADGTEGRPSVILRAAFAFAYRQNRVSCVAMGNHHTGAADANDVVAFPAGFNSGLIAVGATDITDAPAFFSARGNHIDVSAPGDGVWSTSFNNAYIDEQGTSMATPHVSGLASLLKGFNTNLANDDIEQIIRLTTDDANVFNFPGFDNQLGTGRINAQRALQSLQAPNQLFQWSTTGGTVFASGTQQTRNFLGFPGLSDGRYTVIRREVRTNVTFPTPMCTMIGAWGRGVGTTGYREDGNTCYGEGVCEIVPGTLTNNGATLRTWIYDVWNFVSGQYLGTYPRTAANVVFQYTVLGVPRPTIINGEDIVCTTSGNYTIAGLPTGATVQWSASPADIVTVNSPNAAQTTITKDDNGIITLTATISNTCGGTIVLSKNITVGVPTTFTGRFGNYPQTAVVTTDDGSNDINSEQPTYVTFTSNEYITPNQPGIQFSNMTLLQSSQNFPGSSYQWQYIKNSSFGELFLRMPADSWAYFEFTLPNACGTGTFYLYFQAYQGAYYRVSPNPAKDMVTVQVDEERLIKNKATKSSDQDIREIDIVDKMGNILQRKTFGKGIRIAILNTSLLKPDVYIVKIFNGKTWKSLQLLKE